MSRIKTLLLLTGLLSLVDMSVRGQCNNNNYTMSADTVCAGDPVTFSIVNPNPNANYFWNFGQGGGVDEQGATTVHTYPARDFNRNYTVTAFNNAGTCIQTITVLATPDASLQALTGAMPDENTIAWCGSTSDFPEFDLTVQNTSTTTGDNTQYTIDWGDGSAPYTGAVFNTLSHTYAAQGQYFLTLTVEAGDFGCSSATTVYEIFNSSDPGGSIVNTTNTVTTCFPHTIGYPILGTGNNIPGTTYEISISGELVAVFNHPPPDTFYYTFEESSCDQGVAPFDDDEFVVQMEVISPCQNKLSFVTARLGTPPEPSFTMNPSVICEGETLTLTNVSEGSQSTTNLCSQIQMADWEIVPASYNIISGSLQNSQTLEVELLDDVAYTITMWVENMCGEDSITQVITRGVTPTADAVGALTQPAECIPATATFTNLSVQDSSIHYTWSVSPSAGVNFINGTTNTSFEPEIQFNNGGLFTVVLTASNECGSPQWDTTFDIRNRPNIVLPEIVNLCADTFIYVSNAVITGDPDVVNWTFAGGTPSSFSGPTPPPVVFSGTGSYSVTVTAGNSCGDTTVTEVFALSDPIPMDAGSDLQTCFNGAVVTLGGAPAGGLWTGAGVTGTNTFDPVIVGSGNYALTYTYDNGICSVSDDIAMEVIGISGLTAGSDETACINEPAFDLSGQSPAGGTWLGTGIVSAANGTFNPAVAGIGTHSIGYTYSEPVLGCADTVYKTLEVLDVPAIEVSGNDTACIHADVSFSTSVLPGGSASWVFGDGNTGTGFSVNHVFEVAGEYWVKVTVQAGAGCADVDSTLIRVIDVPDPLFVPDNPLGCGELIVNFNNQTTGHADSYFWDFGDGNSSTDVNPVNVVFEPGTYNDTSYYVSLTAANQCGEAAYSDSVYVTKVPVALFGTNVNSICPGQELFINNISYNSPEGFIWDFGNGVNSTATNPAPQVYPVPDDDTTYTITLISYNGCGSDTLQKEILVKTVHVVSFFNTDPLTGCEPLTVDFINYSTLTAFPVWDFGDGNTSTRDTIRHLYENAGVYTVSLAVDNGCSRDTTEATVTVLPSPTVEFNYPELGCESALVAFTNQSSGAFGFAWDFGDGNTSLQNNPNHVYQSGGNYVVTLSGESANGCIAEYAAELSILEKPLADFDADLNNVCLGSRVSFVNLSTGGENFTWDFGDGTLSYQEDPVKQYATAGTYDVSLVANNDNFCWDTIVYPGVIRVFPKPEADFDYSQTTTGVLYGEVEFTNLSSGAQSYSWEFGDGLSSIEPDPVHQFVTSGQYEVVLVSENEFNCLDSITRFIDVEFFGKLFVPNAFSPALGGQSGAAVFLPKGVGLDEYELEIYSSYGELLWRNTELLDGRPAVGWDGTANGKALPQDVYVWKIRAIFDNGFSWQGAEVEEGVKTTVGTLTLIR